MLAYLLLVVAFVRAAIGSRAEVAAENLLLRQQLAVLTRPTRKRPRLRRCDKVFWVLARLLWRRWSQHLAFVQPETVIRWHRQGWKLFWRWRSRPRIGRPRLSAEVRGLIAAMARDNPLWGSERIRGELLKLGVAVSKRSVQRYRRRGPARPPSQTWRTFLANHALAVWAADLFTAQTLTFRTLYVLFFISHSRRELVHFRVTAHPTAAWAWRQLVEATAWGRHPKHLIKDRDRVYGGDFAARAEAMGIRTLLTPFRAPKANAVAERVVRTLRNECLDHVIPLDERHLRTILTRYVDYYNHHRPHRTLQLRTPRPQERPQAGPVSPSPGTPVQSRPILGGLHHVYECAAERDVCLAVQQAPETPPTARPPGRRRWPARASAPGPPSRRRRRCSRMRSRRAAAPTGRSATTRVTRSSRAGSCPTSRAPCAHGFLPSDTCVAQGRTRARSC